MTDASGSGAPIGIGHNNPPVETPDEIAERLGLAHIALVGRRDDLLKMNDRLPAPDAVDDDWEKKLSDGIKAAQTLIKSSEARRADEKEPFLAAERAVDGFFYGCSGPIEKLKDRMSALLSAYQRAKARREAERRQEEARKAEAARVAAEAERKRLEAVERKRAQEFEDAARAAEKKRATERDRAAAAKRANESAAAGRRASEAREAAARAADAAEQARRATRARNADLSRSRTDLGVVASLRTNYDFEIEDNERVGRQYCSPDKGKIRAAINAAIQDDGSCKLKIPGVRIFPKADSVVR